MMDFISAENLETNENEIFEIEPIPFDEEGYDMETYNCGGFALGTKDWYHPFSGDDDPQYLFMNTYSRIRENGQDKTLRQYVDFMLKEFPNMRLISSEQEAKKYETIVFFRIGNDDFHFVKKIKNKYYHKRGWIPKIEEMEKEEVYGEYWCDGKYDSNIVILAIDEQKNEMRKAI